MQSKAKTVDEYLAELPQDRRLAMSAVRQVILDNLDKDYEEGMQYGMIGYYIPLRVFPAGYHCDPNQPLCFAGLASQKNHMSLYLMCVYGSEDTAKSFKQAWAKTGKKLDMGKTCVRFKKLDDLALDVIGKTIKQAPVKKYLAWYEGIMEEMNNRKTKAPTGREKNSIKASAKKTAAKKAPAKKKAAAKR